MFESRPNMLGCQEIKERHLEFQTLDTFKLQFQDFNTSRYICIPLLKCEQKKTSLEFFCDTNLPELKNFLTYSCHVRSDLCSGYYCEEENDKNLVVYSEYVSNDEKFGQTVCRNGMTFVMPPKESKSTYLYQHGYIILYKMGRISHVIIVVYNRHDILSIDKYFGFDDNERPSYAFTNENSPTYTILTCFQNEMNHEYVYYHGIKSTRFGSMFDRSLSCRKKDENFLDFCYNEVSKNGERKIVGVASIDSTDVDLFHGCDEVNNNNDWCRKTVGYSILVTSSYYHNAHCYELLDSDALNESVAVQHLDGNKFQIQWFLKGKLCRNAQEYVLQIQESINLFIHMFTTIPAGIILEYYRYGAIYIQYLQTIFSLLDKNELVRANCLVVKKILQLFRKP